MRKNALGPRTMKLVAALVVVGLAGALSALAAAGSSPVTTPRLPSNASLPAGKAAAMANRMPSAANDTTPPAALPAFVPDPIPARILGPDVPVPIPASVITETNGWLVSNGYDLVAVYAGADADDPTQGRVVIVRQDLRAGRQTVQIVDAGPTGPLTVAADAPTGAAAETSALRGALTLSTSHGSSVRLDLSTNTVSAK